MNPFTLKNYAGPEYFCDREKETGRLINAVRNQRNLTISSLRKMGKTGLIHHTFHELSNSNDFDTIYFDIYYTDSLAGFINKFGSGILAEESTITDKIKRKINNFIRSIRPTITYDSLSGAPSFSFNIDSETSGERTIEEIFGFLHERSIDKNIVIAIDEFQQISNYPENNVEALLRTNIQALNNVNFIFSGSDNQLITSMFTDAKRPFYQSTEFMHLEEIPEDKYLPFIKNNFILESFVIDDKAILEIFRLTRRHTYYVQYVCNKLYSSGIHHINIDSVKKVYSDILKENEVYYSEYRDLITQQQWNLLIALAKEDGISSVTASDFIRKHDLTNPSTIRRGITSLHDKKMIYKRNSKYYVYDVFFSNWLKRKDK